MDLMEKTLRRVKDSPWAIIMLAIAIWGLWIAVNLTYEDYSTSLAAYNEIPTRKINSDVVAQAAWLPQLIPVLFGFMFMRDTKRSGFAWVSIAILGLDMFTDVWFKTMGLNFKWTMVGLVETFFVYTIGSEVLLTVTVSIVMYLFKPAVFQLIALLNSSADFFREIIEAFTEGKEPMSSRPGGMPGQQTPFRPPPYPTAFRGDPNRFPPEEKK